MTTEVTGSEQRRTFLGQSQSLNRSRRKFGGGGDAGQCEGEGGARRRVGYHCTFLAWNKKTGGLMVGRGGGKSTVMQGDLSGGGQRHQFHLLQKWRKFECLFIQH